MIRMGLYAAASLRRSTVVALSIVLGTLVVATSFEAFNWAGRQSELEFQAGLLLNRSVAIATEARLGLRQAAALRTTPCSPDDIAALNVIVSRSAYLIDVGRIEGRTVLCDASGRLPVATALRPPDRISSRGGQVWLQTPLRGDWRVMVTAAANHGVIVYSRPKAASDVFDGLGDAVAVVSPGDRTGSYMSWIGSGRLVGAEYSLHSQMALAIDHTYARCEPGFDLCVSISDRAPLGILSMSLAGKLGLLAGGGLLGLVGQAVIGSWLAARRTLVNQLRRAIRRDEIAVYYQPMVCIKTRQVTGFEALARWHGPRGQTVPPDIFIPLAERSGLLGDLTERVVDRALNELTAILRARPHLHVSINVAVQQLLSTEFRQMLDRLASRHSVERSAIVVEVTERETGDVARIGDMVGDLRDAGYRVFLDDFGTGYSSLAYLATLPIDTIKLDKLFSRSVGTSLVGTLVLREICRMMATLGLAVVFEGIETEEQARVLEELAPGSMGQGWRYGHPLPVAELVLPEMSEAAA